MFISKINIVILILHNYFLKFHNKKYSQRFWEIVIGKWIHSYCFMMFDRWEVLTKLNCLAVVEDVAIGAINEQLVIIEITTNKQ